MWIDENNAPIPGPMIKPNDVIAENVPKFYHDFFIRDISDNANNRCSH